MNWIIAYDIADHRRLQRVHRYLTKIAIPLQNSLFLFTGSSIIFEQHFSELSKKLNAREDDVRAYPLSGKVYSLGSPGLPDGIFLSDFAEIQLTLLSKNSKE